MTIGVDDCMLGILPWKLGYLFFPEEGTTEIDVAYQPGSFCYCRNQCLQNGASSEKDNIPLQ